RVEMEFDYFTAVDDLSKSEGHDEMGADMLGDVEFNSACFYKYFSLHVDGLLENLDGSKEVAQTVIPAFLEAALVTTPSGKQNTFAAHNLPSAVLVEARPHPQPVSYANAFEKPIRGGQDGLVTESVKALVSHVEKVNRIYEPETVSRFWMSLDGEDAPEGVEVVGSLKALKEKVRELLG
ncbi:MAG TPA: type I-E CRISPR-associated protein Cas7/Cse4/CasC, partial [Phycisphaerales bacterium]|nr:type I-E CRISPR-associated protein Cas7/Cse4/CasC [Phycisphaerales bacterium]